MYSKKILKKHLHYQQIKTGSVLKILVADDSTLIRARLKKLLSTLKNVEIIDECGTVSETVDLINTGRHDVILLDLQFPDGSGVDILHSCPIIGNAPLIIVLTNHSTTDYKNECLKNGAHYFFDKSTEFLKVYSILKDIELI